MTRMTGPDCAVMCNLINTHTHTHRMTRTTGPDCAVMCNLLNTHTHTHTQCRILVANAQSLQKIRNHVTATIILVRKNRQGFKLEYNDRDGLMIYQYSNRYMPNINNNVVNCPSIIRQQ